MTVVVTDPTPSLQAVSAVEDALRALSKAFRSAQLYLPNNPAREQTLELARQAFTKVWAREPTLELQVQESAFLWEGRSVFQDAGRATDSLPWLLYRDGLRAITFLPGCEDQDLDTLIVLLQRARTATTDDDDIVTMLWVADLGHVSYRYVDVGSGVEPMLMSSGDRPGVATFAPGQAPLAVPPAETQPPGEGPRTAWCEWRISIPPCISSINAKPRICRTNCAGSIQKTSAASSSPASSTFWRPVPSRRPSRMCYAFSTNWCSSSSPLAIMNWWPTSSRKRQPQPVDRARATPLCRRCRRYLVDWSEPAAVSQLLHALDESARTPVASLLESLFAELRPEALEPLLGWLGSANASPARASIERASLRLAGAHTAELTRLLEHQRDAVVRGALRLVGQLGTAAAVPGLARLLRMAETPLRADAVGVLADIGSPSALQALERAIDDLDRDVRVATYRAIGSRKHAGALPRLLDAIRRKDTRGADLGEKMALFEAFGALCGNSGVNELDGLLNARGLLGARENAEVRACAARALGLIGTPLAMKALQRAADTKDVVVRNAVARAMRGGQ